jgi:hypothetical protein
LFDAKGGETMNNPDHITLNGVDYVSLAQHQRVLSGGERMRKAGEEEACAMGTPSECLITIADLGTLLETKSLSDMIGKVEQYTGREL